MHSITLLGLAIIAVIILAAVGGWATSGATRLGRELGFVAGLLVGLGVAFLLLPNVSGTAAILVVLLGVPIAGGLLGASALGGVGNAVARGLYRIRLGSLDRLLGAVLSAVGALVICAVLLHLVTLLDPASSVARAAMHDSVGRWLAHSRTVLWL